MTDLLTTFKNAVRKAKLVALCTIIDGPRIGAKLLLWPDGSVEGDLGSQELTREVSTRGMELLGEQRSARFALEVEGQQHDIFVDVQAPPPKLIVVGAVHIAIHLVAFAKQLGFHTIVVDARSAFATVERFPHADELITRWPADALTELGVDESTCVVVLTHDEKLDNPALAVAVNSTAQYIGALGSKKTHARRVKTLQVAGVTNKQISRIYAPIGIDLGGRKPDEIAVSIIAQIVAVRNGQG